MRYLIFLVLASCVAPSYSKTFSEVDSFTVQAKTGDETKFEVVDARPEKMRVEIKVYKE